jgi:hypothetical protein
MRAPTLKGNPMQIPTVKPHAPNSVSVTIGRLEILYSYETPVAADIPGVGIRRTETRYSTTTQRQVNAWAGYPPKTLPDTEFIAALETALHQETETE